MINSSLREKNEVIELERSKSDSILRSVMPPEIAERLKAGENVTERFECVSIVFADVVGFTQLSMKMPPEVMLALLHHIFRRFDAILEKYGGVRMRTMGDGYFGVIGAPTRYDNHGVRMAEAALEMQQSILIPDELSQYLPSNEHLQIRIGLHCGTVIAGLIGTERLQYDIYGDAVNTASRMESHGEAGKIHVSSDFVRELLMVNGELLVEEEATAISTSFTINNLPLTIIPRGEMEIKGKGRMNTYFLTGVTK